MLDIETTHFPGGLRTTRIEADYLLERRLSVHGAVFDGVTDDSGAIQNTFDDFSATRRGRINFPPGLTAKINTGLTLKAGLIGINFNGLSLDASDMASGYALSIHPNSESPFSIWARANPIRDLLIFGPDLESKNVDGIFIGSPGGSGDITGLTLADIIVTGFRDCVYWGDQLFICQLWNFNFENAWRYGLNYVAALVAGENMSLHGGRFGNCNHSANSAIALYMANSDSGSNELNCFGTSFDYNDQAGRIEAGIADLHGCHTEANNYHRPLFEVIHNLSDTPSGLRYNGGEMGITESAANARPELIQITNTAGKAFLQCKTNFNLFDKATKIFRVVSGVAPHVDLSGSHIDYAGSASTKFPDLGTTLNKAFNGDFELGTLSGFITSGTGITWTADSAVKDTGTYSMKAVGTGAGSGNGHQYTPCTPGKQFIFEAKVYCPTRSAGNAFYETRFYQLNPDGSFIQVASDDTGAYSATNAGFTRAGRTVTVPAGATHAYTGLHLDSAFVGTIHIDNIKMYEL